MSVRLIRRGVGAAAGAALLAMLLWGRLAGRADRAEQLRSASDAAICRALRDPLAAGDAVAAARDLIRLTPSDPGALFAFQVASVLFVPDTRQSVPQGEGTLLDASRLRRWEDAALELQRLRGAGVDERRADLWSDLLARQRALDATACVNPPR